MRVSRLTALPFRVVGECFDCLDNLTTIFGIVLIFKFHLCACLL